MSDVFDVRQIGRLESPLTVRAAAPRQPDEGAPEAWLVFVEDVWDALRDVRAGDEYVLLTWLHAADRSILAVHPRGDFDRPEQGVFTTRAPDRPNPIGLHRVRIAEVGGLRLRVDALEAIDGTPILDLKPVIGDIADR
jgi:tRNA-Thr(GGU) m(6)t(6)A37 methyltransferase TsaA